MTSLKEVFKSGCSDYTEALGVSHEEYELVKSLDVLMQEFVDEAKNVSDLDEEKFILKIIESGAEVDTHFRWMVLGMKISQLKFSISQAMKNYNKNKKENEEH